jgi:acetyl esterase/lipase
MPFLQGVQYAIRHALDWFTPTRQAFFGRGLPFDLRWRLLLLQPVLFLICSLKRVPWTFSSAYSVRWIPTRNGRQVRAIVFQPHRSSATQLVPLHVSIHGGSFMYAVAEAQADFAAAISQRTGSVVVSPEYRGSPTNPFPAAIDDIDDVLEWLVKHGEKELRVDPRMMTTSGFSAGGNLALAASQQAARHEPSSTAIRAAVLCYAPVCSRSII